MRPCNRRAVLFNGLRLMAYHLSATTKGLPPGAVSYAVPTAIPGDTSAAAIA